MMCVADKATGDIQCVRPDDRWPLIAHAGGLHCGRTHSARGHLTRLLVVALPVLSGCSYLADLGPSAPSPDTRIKLGQTDSLISVSPREIERYTCVAGLLLMCERSGGFTYRCTCEPLPVSVGF